VRSSRAQIYHNLAVMLNAGVPVLQALRTSVSGLRGRVPRAVRKLGNRAGEGESVAAAMRRHPRAFGPLDPVLIEAAEASGRLPSALENLARWYEFRTRIRRRIASGLILPIVFLHMAAVIGPSPRFFLGQLTTEQYIRAAVTGLAIFYGPAVLILAVVKLTPSRGPLRGLLDFITLGIPILGKSVYYLALARFTRTFHMLTASGVPVTDGMRIATRMCGNAGVRRLLRGGIEAVQQGREISEGFSRRLPGEFVGIWQTGEQTGTLDRAAERLANNMADRAEELFGHFAAWFPRFVYALVCLYMIYQIYVGASAIVGQLTTAIP